jgi:hypothetical protein
MEGKADIYKMVLLGVRPKDLRLECTIMASCTTIQAITAGPESHIGLPL